jgi:outer membrane protein OmpA-like peptidoglycan-associated protein
LDRELQAARQDAQGYRAEAEQLRARLGTAAAPLAAPSDEAAEGLTKLEARLDSPAVLEPLAGPAATGAVAVREGWAMTRLDGSAFAAGSFELRPEAAPMLAAVAAFIRAQPAGEVRIVGHTDSNGDNGANRLLSIRRAEKVLEYLVGRLGFERARLSSAGAGEDQPVSSNDTAAGRRSNRRVEIYVRPSLAAPASRPQSAQSSG